MTLQLEEYVSKEPRMEVFEAVRAESGPIPDYVVQVTEEDAGKELKVSTK